ncbi:hypothetical protein [Actinomycetospora sp. NBRC 106378]|uniref:hypothetical protein n=1 Tax=Actinomycetospora sp. NBRC 106378 TaxID=3032208 RepID=UPI0024A492A1|nr:hypothetical protein [Actinomycetospora sp. NBRC 106378]GLZ56416.1 hypothetical protein Acsp07_60330 [Actinomycetospora sp. NBRC 106378]
MAARREHGAPSALTVLEVAEGLRWTDPALGASLAEHVRRLAGDDPTIRAAADRSLIRSLAESDRHEDVVDRGVPLLSEARARGDRDDGAEVLVELAGAATGLGDAPLARRLLDRLGPVADLPARVAAAASAARAEACAVDGDVAGTDAAGDDANPVLFRVPQSDAAVVRARVALAYGIARRRAGDVPGALAAFDHVVSADPSGDVDGGRRSLQAAAERTEVLIEAGRRDEARDRAVEVLPDGSPGAHVVGAVARIRLALSEAEAEGGARSATTVAEDLEAGGRLREAARAWELVAGLAEAEGDLGRALSALRRAHGLGSRARDTGDRALRALAAVADGADPLAGASPVADDTAAGIDGTGPTRRRERRHASAADDPATRRDQPGLNGDGPTADPDHGAGEEIPRSPDPTAVAAEVPSSESSDVPAAPQPTDRDVPGPGSSTRDELAELLASLTRSVDSSRAAVSAVGLEPERRDDGGPAGAEGNGEPVRRSRHSAFPPPTASSVGEAAASRPTFDAFSTAPPRRGGEPSEDQAVLPGAAPLPDDRFAPAEDGIGTSSPVERAAPVDAAPPSVSSLIDPLADPLPVTETGLPVADEQSPLTATPSDGGSTAAGRSGSLPSAVGDSAAPSGQDPVRTTTANASDGVGAPGFEHADAARAGTGWADPEVRASGGAVSVEPALPAPDDPVDRIDGTAVSRTSSPASAAASSWGAPADIPVDGIGATGLRDAVEQDRIERRPSDRAGAEQPERRPSPEQRAAASSTSGRERARGGTYDGAYDRGRAEGDRSSTAQGAGGRSGDEYEDELALTLATVLGEYHLPDVPTPPRRDRARPEPPAGNAPATDVAVPSARRHTSGSMPVPGEQRWAPRPESSPPRPERDADDARRVGQNGGRGRPPESGARLADLLAEAMDAFRHVSPEVQDGARGPGVGSRRA